MERDVFGDDNSTRKIGFANKNLIEKGDKLYFKYVKVLNLYI